MKRVPFIFALLILFTMCVLSAAADDDEDVAAADLPVIVVDQTKYYMCGDTFELAFPDVPSTGGMFTNASRIQAEAALGETLLQIRVHMRNMTSSVFHGISPSSFELTGYVRDRSVTYLPELILNTDYFGAGNFYAWDQLPPLRVGDVLLVFRVNPILINWELKFVPKLLGDFTYEINQAKYTPVEAEPCAGIFLFTAVRNLETGELTTFKR